MDKHLIELIKNNNRVIIPDLGAFLIRKQGDSLNINFNSIIKFDDGLFTGYISQKEKTDKAKAKEQLTEYTEKIKAELNKGNQYKISPLGSLYKDANGKIQFIEGEGKAPKASASATSASAKKPEAKEDKPKTTTGAEKEGTKEDKASASQTTNEQSKEQADKRTIHERLQASGQKPGQAQQKGTTANQPSSLKKESTQKQSSSAGATKQSSGFSMDNTKMLITAGIIVGVLGLFAFFWFVLKDKIFSEPDLPLIADTLPEIDDKKAKTATATIDSIEQARKDSLALVAKQKAEAEAKAKAMAAEKKQAYQGKQYYIVAGCFEVEQNADNYVQTLKEKGYNNAKKFRKIGRLHAISFDSYRDHQDALKALRRIQSDYEANAWIMEY